MARCPPSPTGEAGRAVPQPPLDRKSAGLPGCVFKVELFFDPMCHERIPAACKTANHPHDSGALQ